MSQSYKDVMMKDSSKYFYICFKLSCSPLWLVVFGSFVFSFSDQMCAFCFYVFNNNLCNWSFFNYVHLLIHCQYLQVD